MGASEENGRVGNIMVSAFQDGVRGSGFDLSEQASKDVYDFWARKGGAELASTPGIHSSGYGKNKDGYWTGGVLCEKVEDIMHCFLVLYPHLQLILEVDHSARYSTKRRVGCTCHR